MIKQGFDYTLAGYSSVRTSALQYHADRRFNQQTNRSGAWIQQDLRCQQSHYPRAGRLKELHDHTVRNMTLDHPLSAPFKISEASTLSLLIY